MTKSAISQLEPDWQILQTEIVRLIIHLTIPLSESSERPSERTMVLRHDVESTTPVNLSVSTRLSLVSHELNRALIIIGSTGSRSRSVGRVCLLAKW